MIARSALVCIGMLIVCTFRADASHAQVIGNSLLEDTMLRSPQDVKRRIINGRPASFADNPWQVALVWSGNPDNVVAQFCGGSIIGDYWIVTAGHCIDKSKPKSAVEVLSGTDSLESGGVRSTIADWIVHTNYSTSADRISHDFDVALIEITRTSNRLRGQRVLPLSRGSDELPLRTPIRVTGWGVTERRWDPTIRLLQVDVPYVGTPECNSKRSYNGRVTETMLCAGEKQGGKDPCRGDSGGPATTDHLGSRTLVGITSWGIGCGEPDHYGVYARVSKFRDWVTTKTRGEVTW